MRKYLVVSRIAFMDRLAMRSDLFLGVIMDGVRLVLARLLWQAVFSGRPELGGFSLAQMTSYYLIVSFIARFDQSEGYVWEFAAEIRSGTFGKYLVRPVDPLRHFISVCAGRSAFQAILACAAAVLWAIPFIPMLAPLDPLGTAAAVPILFLGLFALGLLNFLTVLLAFLVQDILPYHMVKNSIVEFCSGALIPLSVFPGWARSALEATPFPALASLPASLMLGRGWEGYPKALAVLACWNAALWLACRLAYGRLSRVYEEAGS